LILVRELEQRLGLELVDRHLSDSRRGKNIQLPLPACCGSQSIAAWRVIAGVDDAERLSQDPSFRLIGSRKS